MVTDVKFFEGEKDLEVLTGLSHDELWDAGFDLDDMDFGIATDEEWIADNWYNYPDAPYYKTWMLNHMESHCVGYKLVKYKDKYYYTVHHS